MKVICKNCDAKYKIPDASLPRQINPKNCRKCGLKMLVPRPISGMDKPIRVDTVFPTATPVPNRNLGSPPPSEAPTLPLPDDGFLDALPLLPEADLEDLYRRRTRVWSRGTLGALGVITVIALLFIGFVVRFATIEVVAEPTRPIAAASPVVAAVVPTEPVDRVSTEVVHETIFHDVEVQSCFLPLFEAGDLPGRVDVQFTLRPTGRADQIRIGGDLAGSPLESCLVDAVGALSFPPIRQSGQQVTYPFIKRGG